MKRFSQVGLLLLLVLGAAYWSRSQLQSSHWCEIVQNGRVQPVRAGGEIELERAQFAFRLRVEAYDPEGKYAVQLAADEHPPGTELKCFEPGHSLAIEPGGYSSLYLSWVCGHYLFYDPEGPSSLTLVEKTEAGDYLTIWEVNSLIRWSVETPLTPILWEEAPNLHLLLNHPEHGQIPFKISWATPAR